MRAVRPLRPDRVLTELPGAETPAVAESKRRLAHAVLEPSRPAHSGPRQTPTIVPLPRRDKQRLARGHSPIDARLDLHGMTQGEAHAALARFLGNAQANGARFVLVITGNRGARRNERTRRVAAPSAAVASFARVSLLCGRLRDGSHRPRRRRRAVHPPAPVAIGRVLIGQGRSAALTSQKAEGSAISDDQATSGTGANLPSSPSTSSTPLRMPK